MVYRPPKKKSPSEAGFPPNRPSADPLEGPLQGQPRVADPRQGDDRNLVVVDPAFAEADFEDRLWLFWQRRRGLIFGLIALVLFAALAWWAGQMYRQHEDSVAQNLYQALDGPEALLAFGHDHATLPLGRLALLEAGDGFYQKSQYDPAAAAYAEAAAAWTGVTDGQAYAERAQFGHAMALLLAGKKDEGNQALQSVAQNPAISDNFRGESDYYLAMLALQADDLASAKKWDDQAKALPMGSEWARQTEALVLVGPVLEGKSAVAQTAPAPTATAIPAVGAAPPPAQPPAGATPPVTPGTMSPTLDLGLPSAPPAPPPPAPPAPVAPAAMPTFAPSLTLPSAGNTTPPAPAATAPPASTTPAPAAPAPTPPP